MAHIVEILRYPVKGLSPEPMASAELRVGQTLPFDRAWAFEVAPGKFDPAEPRHLPKINFAMLMRDERLAALRSSFDEASQSLTLDVGNGNTLTASLASAEGQSKLSSVIERHLGPALRGRLTLVNAPGHSFSDVAAKCLHIINLASVRALETLMQKRVDPLRFRPNLILDGLHAWQEFDWIGDDLKAGAASLRVFKRTMRCAATNVDPKTAMRDLQIPAFLARNFGHSDFGVYANVTSAGWISQGDAVDLQQHRLQSL